MNSVAQIPLSVSENFHNKQTITTKTRFCKAHQKQDTCWAFGAFTAVTWTPEQVIEHVASGKALSIATYKDNWRAERNYIESWLIGIDFDDGPDVQTLLGYPLIGEYAFCIFPTASHLAERPRSRVFLATDQPIHDAGLYRRYNARIRAELKRCGLIPDDAAKDAARFFYGSTQAGFCNRPTLLLPLAVIEALEPAPEELREMRRIEPIEAPRVVASNGNHAAYVQAAINDELALLASTPEGRRNPQLNKTAFNLGQLVGAHWTGLNRMDIEPALINTAQQIGLDMSEILPTLQSGIEAGMREPRAMPANASPAPYSAHNGNGGNGAGGHSVSGTNALQTEYVDAPDEDLFDLFDTPPLELVKGPNTPPPGGKKGSEPTQDELGDVLVQQWNGNRAFMRESWHTYDKAGVWTPEHNPDKDLWNVMIAHKHKGIKPSPLILRGIESYTRSRLRVRDEDVDNGAHYVNLKNGLFNLQTGELEAHRRDLYLTSQLGFAYDPKAECSHWQIFLSEMLVTPDGVPDHDLINLLQEAIGYSLTTDTSYRVSFWLYGETASGKSTVINVLKKLLGSAQVEINLSALDTNQYQLADIAGKRVITCTEAKAGSALEDNVFKGLVAGEELVVREIRKAPIRIKPQAKIWWAMNDKPRVNDRSDAVYSRTILIPFNNSIPRERWDLKLHEKLEAEVAGIFNWALAGLERLRRNNDFTRPAQVIEAVKEFKAENDTEAAFAADWTDKNGEVSGGDLYSAYKIWCVRNGHSPKSSTKVAKDWQRLGFSKRRSNQGIVYQGVSLSVEALKAVAFTGESTPKT